MRIVKIVVGVLVVLGMWALVIFGMWGLIDLVAPKITHYTITSEIGKPKAYQNLINIYRNAKKGDIVYLHIGGPGGQFDSAQYILSNMKHSNAKTIAVVEFAAYSADAYIAASADELQMRPGTFLMFHTVSTHALSCDDSKGQLDRGRDSYTKCLQYLESADQAAKYFVNQIKILTPEEKTRILDGYDVYIQWDEIKRRQSHV